MVFQISKKIAKEFQTILRYLGVADANMEKGEMRVEANISVSDDPNKLGTKVEVKNLNSFKVVEKAIKFEVERMIKLHEEGRGDRRTVNFAPERTDEISKGATINFP